jgi:hypothetical protein
MQIIGNIVLFLAAFLYLLPLQILIYDVGRKKDDGGALWAAIFVLVPLWILLTSALMLAAARGGFDWLPLKRGPQYLLACLSGVALLVLTFFSFLGKVEHPNQIPWAARPFSVWALYLFPLVVMGFAFLVLNASVSSRFPPVAYRAPMAAVAALSLLACGGMVGQWIMHSRQQQVARVERAIADDNKRDRDIMERVQSLNPTNDFAELLGFANRFESQAIRKVAIQKAESHQEFTAALIQVLQNGWAERGLVYLDACDVSDRKTLAEPVLAAIKVLTADARDSVNRTHTFYAGQFDWNTRLILSVVQKFADQDVDYVAAIRAYRRSLDSQRTRDVELNARRTLDAWLAQHESPGKSK